MLVRLRPLTKYIAAQNAALGQAAAALMVYRHGCALTVPIFEKRKKTTAAALAVQLADPNSPGVPFWRDQSK
jgi:hypothetical protein